MSYKIGDIIRNPRTGENYRVTRDFDSANGGQCQWGFAQQGREEFFIKKFLSPVFPGRRSPGSEHGKQKRREKCNEFEKKQAALIKALAACGDGGLVVRTIDCFRYGDEYGEHYFKVSQKVNTSTLSDRVHTLELKKRLFVMLTAAGALSILHRNKIIHLDLKPDNILIQEYDGKLIAKIIDFDSSMLEGETIDSELLVGDQVYYSPEFAHHIVTRGEGPIPTKKSDIFSLGLVFCRYWAGRLPYFPSRYHFAYEAVLNGESLTIPGAGTVPGKAETARTPRLSGTLITPKGSDAALVDTGVRQLLTRMLAPKPESRLSITDVHHTLKHLYHHGTAAKPDATKDTPEPGARLRFGKNLKR